ncbi:hypothetical protein B5X24_HaOG204023 [Helicoverpa armigera]|uniref:Fucosyltransferase n=1 Tax=Helicoverpa armigera TaxID=29058 RepID=A0A2W1BTB4_HELAM|nr:hypothetical protein B5X24_HaOG204023 [Helicoverpa armigera]
MWVRAARAMRALRRAALLVPLALTALLLLLLPRPPALAPAPRSPSPPPPLRVDLHIENAITESDYAIGHEDETTKLPWFMRGGEHRPKEYDPEAKLFPEDSPGDDRVVNQLMYTLPKDEDVPIKKILLANGLGAWGVSGGRTEFIRNKCPIWILYYLECPYHTASLRPSSVDVFNWTSTYRRDSDIVAPYEHWVYYDPLITEKDLDRNFAANKTKKVAWFVSNCHARNRRLQYARQLSKYIQVDIYGACGAHHCPRTDPNCLEMLDKDYKFYLAFENSNCRDYVTEKFFVNGLQHNVLPIVMGARASEYASLAPHNSYVHVEEFASPEELATYLRRLDEDDNLYNSYFKWKGTGEFINTYFFCRVCAMVHANERRQRSAHYDDVQAWWRDGACTRSEWRTMQKDTRDNG